MTVEQWELLSRHHRRVVDEFIESVLDELDLGDLERNVVGLVIRQEVETVLAPGLAAVQAVFHAADAGVLGKDLPEWLEQVSSTMPAESGFFTEMGRRLDPVGAGLLDENLGIGLGESEVRRIFDAHLWEIAPLVNSPE